MHFLAITRRRTERFSPDDFARRLDEEADRARALYAENRFVDIRSRGDVPGAVITVEAADVAEAEAIVATLPFAIHEMMDVTIVPLLPYRGFVGG